MADPLQQCVQMVIISNGTVWGLFVKCVPKQTKGQLSIVVCSEAWALFTKEGKSEEGLGYHTKQGRRDDWSVCFCLGWWLWGLFCDSTGCCCTCARLPQCVGTNVASRMLCLLLQGWYLQGVAGEGQMPRKSSFSYFPLVKKVNPALRPSLLLQPGISSLTALLQDLSTTPLTTRGCRSVDHQQLLSLLSCWFAWQGPGCVLACPTESGPLLKMVANNVCGLPGKHVVELSLWNM